MITKSNRLYFLLLPATILLSCGLRDKKPSKVITEHITHLDLANSNSQTVDIGKFYTGVPKLINLQYAKDFIIGSIDKIVVYKHYIYILDKSVAKRLFIYNLEGKPIKSFDGKEGDEIYSINDFSIDGENLYVLDERKKTILTYDTLLKKLKKDIYLVPNNICNLEVINGDIICYRSLIDNRVDVFRNSSLFLIDQDGVIKDFWLPITKENFYLTRYSSDFPVLNKDNKFVYISRFMDDNLYKYSYVSKQVFNSYAINFKEYGIPASVKAINSDVNFVDSLERGKYSYSMSDFTQNKLFTKLLVSRKGVIKTIVVTNDGKYSETESISYKDSYIPLTKVGQVTDNLFVSVISLNILTAIKANFEGKITNDPFIKKVMSFDANKGNPMVILIEK